MPVDRTNIVICPHCGAENIEGTDTCENCLMDLRTVDVPGTVQAASDSELLEPISSLRASRAATVPVTASVRESVAAIRAAGSGAIVITDGDRIAGILSERDVLKKIAGRPELAAEPVSAFMTPDPVVLRDDDTMAAALNKMGDGGFRHIPITRQGELVGMVNGRDVVNWIMTKYFA